MSVILATIITAMILFYIAIKNFFLVAFLLLLWLII